MTEAVGIRGEFRLLHKIGEGGMADVFLAERLGDDGFRTRVALKRLHRGLAMDQYFIRQLVREARLLGQLEHANIVKVFDLRRLGDEYYVVMEYVDGIDLAQVIRVHRSRKTRIPRPFFFHVALSLTEALAYAHSAVDENGHPTPLIHRDIKPSNVMLSRRGIVKLTDFGIAHVGDGSITGGLVQGTANYMSPEQAFGEERLSAASDVYSLGAVFYEMLCGRPLVDGDNYLKAIHQVRERRVTLQELEDLGVEPGLRMVIAKMLAGDIHTRYQEMESVRNDLQFVADRLKVDLSWHRIRAYVGRLMGILGRAPDRATLSGILVPEEIKAANAAAAQGALAEPVEDSPIAASGPSTPPTPVPAPRKALAEGSVTSAVKKDLLDGPMPDMGPGSAAMGTNTAALLASLAPLSAPGPQPIQLGPTGTEPRAVPAGGGPWDGGASHTPAPSAPGERRAEGSFGDTQADQPGDSLRETAGRPAPTPAPLGGAAFAPAAASSPAVGSGGPVREDATRVYGGPLAPSATPFLQPPGAHGELGHSSYPAPGGGGPATTAYPGLPPAVRPAPAAAWDQSGATVPLGGGASEPSRIDRGPAGPEAWSGQDRTVPLGNGAPAGRVGPPSASDAEVWVFQDGGAEAPAERVSEAPPASPAPPVKRRKKKKRGAQPRPVPPFLTGLLVFVIVILLIAIGYVLVLKSKGARRAEAGGSAPPTSTTRVEGLPWTP